ncbi:MAG TPA: WxcM-like domain-containing protein [Candidatus Eisenbacteria bacterium]|nr:WxcM-like domain-containing protein [Candidatus Eisenbacteria bacterium]
MPIKVTKILPEFTDTRGSITRLIDQNNIRIQSILWITSKKGSVRANHYHKKDYHYVYCVSGKFIYSEKDMQKPNGKISSVVLLPGDLVLTKPMILHSMEFLENTIFMAFTSETRKQKAYEKDTKRMQLVKS